MAILVLGQAATPATPEPQAPQAEEAIRLGRSALARGTYPWYDQESDETRVVAPPEPPGPCCEWLWDTGDVPGLSWVPTAVTVLMYVAAALLIGCLVYFLVRNFSLGRRGPREEPMARADVDRIEELPVELRRGGDFLAEAERLAAQGDRAGAMVYFYSHQLLLLDKAGFLRLGRGKTNRQYVREVAASLDRVRQGEASGRVQPLGGPAASMGPRPGEWLLDRFRTSVRLFEEAFFGHLPIDAEAFRQVWEGRGDFARLLEAVP